MKFIELRTNDLICIDGYRGDGERRYGRVLSIRDTHKQPVTLATMFRQKKGQPMTRGRYCVTMFDVQRKCVRCYYVAHMNGLRRVGLLRSLLLKLCS